MTLNQQLRFWAIALALLLALLWLFADILLPFVAGMALAYLLDPVADRLERVGIPRLAATLLILAVFTIIFIVAVVALVPVLASQLDGARLAQNARAAERLMSDAGLAVGLSDRTTMVGERASRSHR